MPEVEGLARVLENALRQGAEKAAKEAHKRRLDEIVKIQSALFDKASAYTNVIMAAGYAGFFAVWSNMKTLMSSTEMRMSALSVLLSLAIFVGWELYKMVFMSAVQRATAMLVAVPAEEFEAALAKNKKAAEWHSLALMKVWPWVLRSALATGLLGAGTLTFAFVRGLF